MCMYSFGPSDHAITPRDSPVPIGIRAFDLGIFFTPGEYKNILKKPAQYVNPILVNTVFDKGFYKLYAEFKGDTVIIYPETYCRSKNLDQTFYLKRVQNFGDFAWVDLKNDTTGRFMVLSNM